MSLPLIPTTVNACSGCGNCCKDFGSDGVSTGLAMFPYEYREYKRLAQEKNLVFKAVPKIVAVHKQTAQAIISHYVVLTQPCIFYDEHKGCTIYTKRPLTCQAFPYSISRFDDLMIGKSTARNEFINMAEQLGEQTPGIIAARKQLAQRDVYQQKIQQLLDKGVLTTQTAFSVGSVDVDELVEQYFN